EGTPTPTRCEHERDEHAELRLVGDQPEQDAADDRAAVELQKRAGEQCGGEEAVMAMPEIDEHGREGEREEEPFFLYPSPERGGWRRAKRGAGWGYVRQAPTRPASPVALPRKRG